MQFATTWAFRRTFENLRSSQRHNLDKRGGQRPPFSIVLSLQCKRSPKTYWIVPRETQPTAGTRRLRQSRQCAVRVKYRVLCRERCKSPLTWIVLSSVADRGKREAFLTIGVPRRRPYVDRTQSERTTHFETHLQVACRALHLVGLQFYRDYQARRTPTSGLKRVRRQFRPCSIQVRPEDTDSHPLVSREL